MKVPYVNFKTRINDNDAVGGCTFIGGEWKEKTKEEKEKIIKEAFDPKAIDGFGE